MRLAHDGVVLDEALEISLQRTDSAPAGSHRPRRSYGRAPLAASGPVVLAGMGKSEAFWIGLDRTDPHFEVVLRVRVEAPHEAGTRSVHVPPERWLDGFEVATCEQLSIELATVRRDSTSTWMPSETRVRIVIVGPDEFLARTGRSVPAPAEADRYRGRRYP